MKFSLNWLKEFVEITCEVDELEERLTKAGFEVDACHSVGERLKGITTAKIQSIAPHPNADKLVVTQVYDGERTHQIVTGASNIQEGDIVPVSLPGAVLANGVEIKEASLRGEASFGMLCSESELGVSEASSGIWILPKATPLGVDFCEYALLKDTILDVAILPNRGDCQSIFGLARELSVILGTPLKAPEFRLEESPASSPLKVSVQASELCSYYTARVIKNITCFDSPMWMQRRLALMGIRPLSLIVDVTNYVLLEYGQPLHAFDYGALSNTQLKIRCADPAEKIETIDAETRLLSEEMLVIADGEGPVAVAGVMGGKRSSISDDSRDIVLESALFQAGNVRRTSQALGLRSESSIRFEKGVDPQGVLRASDRAAFLLQTIGQAEVVQSPVEYRDASVFETLKITDFSIAKLNGYLGTQWSEVQVTHPLIALGYRFTQDNTEVCVPSWRQRDTKDWPDLAEEVARIIGYDQIPSELPNTFAMMPEKSTEDRLIEKLQRAAALNGFDEQISFPMISESDMRSLGLDPKLGKIMANPLNPTESIMRPSLLPSLLKVYAHNAHRQQENLHLFEVGHVFPSGQEESTHFALVFKGELFSQPYHQTHRHEMETAPFIKGLASQLLGAISLPLPTFHLLSEPPVWGHPKKSLAIKIGERQIGLVTVLHPQFLSEYTLSPDIAYIELYLAEILPVLANNTIYQPFSKFPSTRRDITFAVPVSMSFESLYSALNQYKPKLCRDIRLFDTFQSEKLGDDMMSMSFALTYQDATKTLSDEDVNKAHQRFTQFITQKLSLSTR